MYLRVIIWVHIVFIHRNTHFQIRGEAKHERASVSKQCAIHLTSRLATRVFASGEVFRHKF